MNDITLEARLKRLKQKADEAKAHAENAFNKNLFGAMSFWDGVEAGYRSAIQVMQGAEDTVALMIK